MGSALTTIGLPVALGIVMFGLGLTLTVGDFARVGRHPKAVIIAVVTLPIIANLAIAFFMPGDPTLGLQLSKVLEVFAIVLLPVALGMLVRWWKPRFAAAMDKPVRIASVVILVVVIAGAVYSNIDILVANFASLALITVLFCLLSLTIGYWVPKLFGVRRAEAVASGFEIGIHNATLAIVIAQTVLGSVELSLPAAVYGVLMFFVAAAFGFVIRGRVDSVDSGRSAGIGAIKVAD